MAIEDILLIFIQLNENNERYNYLDTTNDMECKYYFLAVDYGRVF